MSSETVTCPVEECEYDGLRQSVVAHYSGKHDDAHSGGYHVAREVVPEPGEGPAADGSGGENPLVSDGPEADAEPDAEPGSQGSEAKDEGQDADLGCPDCGGELVDYRQYDTGEIHTIQGTSHYVRGDYRCAECKRWWVDE